MTTADGRRIDFFLIGPPKCGTTTVHDVLRRHPDIFLPASKDKSYLVDAVPNYVTEDELSAYYTQYRGEVLIGCSEANLICSASALRRLHRYNPNARLITVLRNPVERAYSAFWYWRSNLLEDCAAFEDALAREPERERGDYRAANLCYRGQGRYAGHLEEVLALFPAENLFVALFEDLRSDPEAVLSELMSWLGVDPAKVNPEAMRQHSNAANMPRSHIVQRVFARPPSWLRGAYHAVLPARAKAVLRARIIEPILMCNRTPFRYPPMAAETRAELTAYFTPHNERLAAMLGRNLEAWR
ncbi:MAG: sulfotransferase domain-containing protein [Alphaproteobacteria bacterium]|nr:sulfotransferase domain-containing protein [Alphaproteobacteria bacterium]